jgi:hypothetical protein
MANLPNVTCAGPAISSDGVLIAAGAAAANTVVLTGAHFSQYLALVISTTTASAGNTVTVTINGISTTGLTYLILASTAIQTVTNTTLQIGPGLPATANASANAIFPDNVQVVVTIAGTVAYGIDYITS